MVGWFCPLSFPLPPQYPCKQVALFVVVLRFRLFVTFTHCAFASLVRKFRPSSFQTTTPSADFCYPGFLQYSRVPPTIAHGSRSPGVSLYTFLRCDRIYPCDLRLTVGIIRFKARFPDLTGLLFSFCASAPGFCRSLPSDSPRGGHPWVKL